MAKRKRKGLTKHGYRRLQCPDGIVHVVRMKPFRVDVPGLFHVPHGPSWQQKPLEAVSIKHPGGTTLCGERAYKMNGTWVDPDTMPTCVGCVVTI